MLVQLSVTPKKQRHLFWMNTVITCLCMMCDFAGNLTDTVKALPNIWLVHGQDVDDMIRVASRAEAGNNMFRGIGDKGIR